MSKRTPYEVAKPSEHGPQWWRSMEERARQNDPALLAAMQAEFPKGHFTTPPSEESSDVSRRGFLTLVSSALALAGAEGCRRPIEKIVPYQKMPEQVIPGTPSHYATVYSRRGEALGLLVESHEGRPTKIEGNPEHPSSNPDRAHKTAHGATDLLTQAAILDLYDMDRSASPSTKGADASWDDFEKALKDRLAKHSSDQGAALRVLLQPTNSPTLLRLRAAVTARFPKARVSTYAPVNESNVREGARLAFGKAVNAIRAYDKAKIIVSLDSDILGSEAGNVRSTKLFSAGRRLRGARGGMSRLYVVEPSMTITGASADHRFRAPASGIGEVALALAQQVAALVRGSASDLAGDASKSPVAADAVSAMAKDLAAARGASLVVVGSRQPAWVHAVAHAMNDVLGNAGTTVTYVDAADPSETDNVAEIQELTQAMGSSKVETLLILGGNPVYDAPADVRFGDLVGKVAFSAHLGQRNDETGEKCTWHIPRAHELETWGDQQSLDGTVSVQQPLIAPLRGGRSEIEILAIVAGVEGKAYEWVRDTARQSFTSVDFEADWKRSLRDGFFTKRGSVATLGAVQLPDISRAIKRRTPPAAVSADSLEVVFAPCPKMFDGRQANNVWLWELPDPLTKICWDNAALLHPSTAKALGVATGDVVTLSVGERSIKTPVFIFPGQAPNTVSVLLGYGRTKAGRIGDRGAGVNVYPLRTTTTMGFATAAKIVKTGETYELGYTHSYDWQSDRAIAREATYDEYQKTPNFADTQAPPSRALPLWKDQDYSKGYQWGMTIDLNACTGCNACVIACQAENNVPVVGKVEVARGREMAWLRIDRYFVEPAAPMTTALTPEPIFDDPKVAFEPLACVQCEDAPCENVCPVNATTHSPEGLNDMAYNRCIGTRYCANNCPYKVRRFNYLNWHNDAVWAKEYGVPDSLQLQFNPNVTVRFRGVMEKCTYCVQRIQTSKIVSQRENRLLTKDEVVTACEQVCPADAIVFGDLNNPESEVAKLARLDRSYKLLGELGTRPRTTHLGKVRNPSSALASAAPAAPAEKEHG
jgi:MoCo/4Fe-4S cofactor protein with predicted Tat translocation signal